MGTTRHAKKRMKQRAGIAPARSDRAAELAKRYGIRMSETSGGLRGFLEDQNARHSSSMRVYGGKVYAFKGNSLITLMSLPDELAEDFRFEVSPEAYWRYTYGNSDGKRKKTLDAFLQGKEVFFMEYPAPATVEASLPVAAFISATASYEPAFRKMTAEGAADKIPRFRGYWDLDEWLKAKGGASVQKWLYGHAGETALAAGSVLLGDTSRRAAYYEELHRRGTSPDDRTGREALLAELNHYATYSPHNRLILSWMREVTELAERRATVFEHILKGMQLDWMEALAGEQKSNVAMPEE